MRPPMHAFFLCQCLFALFLPSSLKVIPSAFADTQLDNVKARLAEAAQAAWEIGTRAQALLELDAPSYSVFSQNSLPPPSKIPEDVASQIQPVLDIADMIVSNRSSSNNDVSGPQPLLQDGSAGDPASIGVAVLLANWTGQGSADHLDYAGAATDQINFLYQDVPKTSDGAISHHVADLELWSDFVYMVPPFLAYYGVVTRNQSRLLDAYNQIRLYRNYLRDTNASNMWRHVVFGQPDPGHWSTGNGWAAAGMLRVLATMIRSEFSKSLKGQENDITNWVKEIHSGIYMHLDNTHIFRNYADDNSTFYDASSTALLASTVYRISVLSGDHSHISYAEACRKAIIGDGGLTALAAGNGTQHITADGWLTPVVDPTQINVVGNQSAEGEAFVLMMQAAWKDWQAAGSKGGAMRTKGQAWQALSIMVPAIIGIVLLI